MDDNKSSNDVLDNDALVGLLLALKSLAPEPARKDAMLASALGKIHAEAGEISRADFTTIRADEGVWAVLSPLVEMKLLHTDKATKSRSFLLRLQPNGSLPAHDHYADEECMVLEGEASLGGIQVHTGDYHLALKGLRHGVISSRTGALLFLRTGAMRHAS